PAVAKVLHQRYSAIYVDEYQDTDPAQVRLLQSLTNTDSVLVAVGDPDQSIYGFRGADVGGILRFREDFPAGPDVGADVLVLSETRRFGVNIAAAAGRVIQRVGLGGLPVEIQREHRNPVCGKPDGGVVEVVTFDSSAAQASSVADRIRRARLTGAVGSWSDIAVIVRSAASQLPLLTHALESVGVPVEVSADDEPLHEHRAVATLLDVLAVAADPTELTASRTRAMLQSPMVGVDPIAYRRLGRLLRNVLAEETPTVPPSSDQAIRRAISDDDFHAQALTRVGAAALAPITVMRKVIGSARAQIDRGALVEAVLWAAWSATDWPQRLERAAKGQSATARSANRDLDQVLALFAQAARADQAFGIARPVQNFLAEIADRAISTVSNGSPIERDAVALLTAHGAKGLQWPMVFVVGVQEDTWPDLRSRPSLLVPDRLSEEGIGDPPRVSEALEAERRLFYVACTRAQQTLVLTAVSNAGDSPTSGEQPSRFLAEVAGDASAVSRTHESGYHLSSLSTASMVAALRANLEDPKTSPAVKDAAAQRLARLAADSVSAADPKRWWGLADWTRNETHVRVADEPLRISGSSWSQLDRCSLAWFYEHEVKARSASNSSTAFGSVIHELADAVADGRIPAEVDVLTDHLKSVWPSLGFDSDWQQAAEFRAAQDAVIRYLNWHARRGDTRVIGSELKFNSQIEVPGDSVKVTGSVDRLEIDAEGQLHIYDLKTQKKPETGRHLATHRQLELYQLVANEGAFDDAIADHASELFDESAGRPPVADAALVLLRIPGKDTDLPRVQVQEAVPVDVVKDELSEAVSIVRSEAFVPTANEYCGFCNFRSVCPAQPESAEVAR
ncbi:MAG: ATP-dependent DNA helicase, partial [Candidatus Nanopelagicales bacterium]